MVINYESLEFDHMVIFESERTHFAAARETDNGRIRLFLVNEITGNVYARNGRADSWEKLYGSDRYAIIARITSARNYKSIPVYTHSGPAQSFVGQNTPVN